MPRTRRRRQSLSRFPVDAPGELGDTALCDRVVRVQNAACEAVDRCEIDDRARARSLHVTERSTGDVERSVQVHLQHSVPGLIGHGRQDGHRFGRGSRFGHHGPRDSTDGGVVEHRRFSTDLFSHRGIDVTDNDVMTLGAQRASDSSADTSPGAGDKSVRTLLRQSVPGSAARSARAATCRSRDQRPADPNRQ
jgi:hypothetical protein